MFRFVRRLYDRTLALSAHPRAGIWLGVISFAESSFFPIPPDVMLLPMCLSNRKKALYFAGLCTAASLFGGLFGYAIGLFAFDTVGQGILQFYGIVGQFERFQDWFTEYGSLVVFLAGFSPIPYKVITISSGVFHFPVWQFLLMSFLSRGLRFGAEALIIQRFGNPAMAFIDRHFNTLTVVGAVLLIGGFIAVKWLMPD